MNYFYRFQRKFEKKTFTNEFPDFDSFSTNYAEKRDAENINFDVGSAVGEGKFSSPNNRFMFLSYPSQFPFAPQTP